MASTRSMTVRLRVRPKEAAAWAADAKRADKTLSEWIREAAALLIEKNHSKRRDVI